MLRDHKPTVPHTAQCLGNAGWLQSQLGATQSTLQGCIPPQRVPPGVVETLRSSRHFLAAGRRAKGSSLPLRQSLATQTATSPLQTPALHAVRPYRPKTPAKITFSFPSQPAIFTRMQRAIYIYRGLAGKVMAGHSSPSARHLARHRSISYRRGQAAAVVGQEGEAGGCITAMTGTSLQG